MQISRHFLLACAVAAYLTPNFVHAIDNEAQIRARQALEDKMQQIGTQTNAAPPVVAKKPAKKPTPAPAPAKPTPPPAPVVQAPPPPVVTAPEPPPAPVIAPEISQPATPSGASMSLPPVVTPVNSNDAKLQEALHEKMSQTPVASEPMKPAKPVKPAPAPVVKAKPVKPTPPPAPVAAPAPIVVAPAPTPAPAPAPVVSQPAPVYAPLPSASTKPSPTLPPQPAPVATKPANQTQMPPAMTLPALSGPPSSLSATKQQELDSLLQQYRADQLTPQQYHEQRAKILAEP